MRLPSYLFRNKFGIYYFRIVFPEEIRAILRRKEIKRSLRTHTRKTAISMSLEFRQISEKVFHLIIRENMNWIETKKFFDNVAERLYQSYVEKVEQVGFEFDDGDTLAKIMPEASTFMAPNGPEWQYIVHRTQDGRLVNRDQFEAELSTRTEVIDFVEDVVAEHKLPLEKGSDEYKQFCRQTLEMLYRLDKRKEGYRDGILYGNISTQAPVTIPVKEEPAIPAMSIREVIEKYCDNKITIEKAWKNPRTIKGYKENLNRVADIFDCATKKKGFPIVSMNKEHAREVRRILSIIPTNLKKKYPKLTFKQIIKKCEKGEIAQTEQERLKPSTFNTYANLISGLFKYAQLEGYVQENHFTNLRVKKQIKQSRSAFTEEELRLFFNTDLYAQKDFPAKWAWRYWVPTILLYTGARVEEICQLYIDDIYDVKGVLCFHFREKWDKDTNEKITSLKNQQSERLVPVHPKLKKIGLLRYVNWLQGNGKDRLFPTLKNKNLKGKYKQINPPVSKWFNENDKKQRKTSYIKKCGITDKTKVLYCFRHTVETLLINHKSEIEHDKIDAIMGHQTRSTGRVHYGSYDPTTLLRVVRKINYPDASLPWDQNENYAKIFFDWQ